MAQQPQQELKGKDLFRSNRLDALGEQLQPTLQNSTYTDNAKHNWFVSMKSMLSKEKGSYDAAVDKANHHVENVISGQYPQYDKNRLGFKMYQKLSDKTYVNNSFIQAQTADIFSKMHLAVTEKTPTQEQMITLVARAVLLEAVKKEQAFNNGGRGPIEQSMRDNPEEAINGMKNNETFKALTKNVSVDMLKHFFMTDAEVSMQETIANAEKRAMEQQADAQNAPGQVKQNQGVALGS